MTWKKFQEHFDKLVAKSNNKVTFRPHVMDIYGNNNGISEALTNFAISLQATVNKEESLNDSLGNDQTAHLLPNYKDTNWNSLIKKKQKLGWETNDYSLLSNLHAVLGLVWNDYQNKRVQRTVELFYSPHERKTLTRLDLGEQKLKGDLDLAEFINLRSINLSRNLITSLKVDNCSQLTKLEVFLTNLKKLDLTNNHQLTYLDLYSNENLTKLEVNYSQLSFLDIWNTKLIKGQKIEEQFQWLWVNVFRKVESAYPDVLAQGIIELVDIKDLDELVKNFDWKKFQSDEDYQGQFVGENTNQIKSDNKVENYHLSLVLEYLSQQVLSRCLVKQNQLASTSSPKYEEGLEAESKKWRNRDKLGNPWEVDLKDIQRAVDKELTRQGKGEQISPNNQEWDLKDITFYGGVIILIIIVVGWLASKIKGK